MSYGCHDSFISPRFVHPYFTDSIFSMTGVRDSSAILREAIRVCEEQFLLARMVAACARHADDSAAMIESFDVANMDLDT